MPRQVLDPGRVAAEFDGWTLARQPLELWRDGIRLRLQELPLQILELLVSRTNVLVTREELIAHLWPKGVVDFDAGLNTAMRKLRVALGDDAETPKYIETVPRQGYRFIGKPASPAEAPAMTALPAPVRPRRERAWLVAGALLLACVAVAIWLYPRPAGPTQYRVAVLPFENLSSDPANGFFTDGLHDEILSTLANRVRELEVISRTTMMLYRTTPKSVAAIARELGVTHVLEGTVRREGQRVRVTLQLVDAIQDRQLWMETFDRTLADAMTLQSEVATTVSGKLAVKLLAPSTRPAPPNNSDSYDLWLRANLAWQSSAGASTQEIARIEEMYTRAIALDPGYAAAYADRGRVRIVKFLLGLGDTVRYSDEARADIRRAEQLAGATPLILVRKAGLAYLVDGDLDGALAFIAQAESAGPLNADQMMTKANFIAHHGDLDAALALFQRAAALDPGNPTIARFWSNVLFASHQPVEAMRVVEEFDTRLPGRIDYGATSFGYTGSTARWRTEVDRMSGASDTVGKLSLEFDLLRFEKRFAEMRELLDGTEKPLFRQHNYLGSIFGVGLKPVAELRGWERLMAGDAKGAALAGAALTEYLQAEKPAAWNAWWFVLLEAEASLFKGDKALAAARANQALSLLRKYPGFAGSIYARNRAARIFAWAGEENRAMDLLEALVTKTPGVGPAEIVRDPLYAMPLEDNARFRELARTSPRVAE
jgi:TolB-like protein/DNA-binding winged helix-turn-helix (wHTH) protein/tetratricopeptide (TPR) repeat protein